MSTDSNPFNELEGHDFQEVDILPLSLPKTECPDDTCLVTSSLQMSRPHLTHELEVWCDLTVTNQPTNGKSSRTL